MYGQSGVRGIVQTRALSFSLYFLSLVVGVVVDPARPHRPDRGSADLLPESVRLPHLPLLARRDAPRRGEHRHASSTSRPRAGRPGGATCPGRCSPCVIWVLASFVLRGTIAASLGGTSIYGPLSAPIVLLIWLYALAIAVLIGAALNAAIRELWPVEERLSLRARLVVLGPRLGEAPAKAAGRGAVNGPTPRRGPLRRRRRPTTELRRRSIGGLREEAPKAADPACRGVPDRHGRHAGLERRRRSDNVCPHAQRVKHPVRHH